MILHHMAGLHSVTMTYFDWLDLVKFLRDLRLRLQVLPGTAQEKRRARWAGKWADDILSEVDYIVAKRPRTDRPAPVELNRSMEEWLDVAGLLLHVSRQQSPGGERQEHTLDLIEHIHFSIDIGLEPGVTP
jgi:hypothetical protein